MGIPDALYCVILKMIQRNFGQTVRTIVGKLRQKSHFMAATRPAILVTCGALVALDVPARGEGGASAAERQTPLVISGRPEAPLLDPSQLPKPALPELPAPMVYEQLDPSDFVKNPEFLPLDQQRYFLVNLGQLRKDLSKGPDQ